MNNLSEEEISELLNQYDITRDEIEIIETIFRNLKFEDFEYYNLVSEIVSEYQTFKFYEQLESNLSALLRNLKLEDSEYYIFISEVISEYQSFKYNKNIDSYLASSYSNLKDIIIKVLSYKLRSVTAENTDYENEVNSLILRLTDK